MNIERWWVGLPDWVRLLAGLMVVAFVVLVIWFIASTECADPPCSINMGLKSP